MIESNDTLMTIINIWVLISTLYFRIDMELLGYSYTLKMSKHIGYQEMIMTGRALLAVFIAIYYREKHIFFQRWKEGKEDMILKSEDEIIDNNDE